MRDYYTLTRQRFQGEGIAESYEKQRSSTLKAKFVKYREEKIVRRIFDKLKRDLKILDIPCGTGWFSLVLKEYTDFITGADISKPMLDHSKKAGKYSELYGCEIENMPYLDNYFDVILCFRLLHHLPVDKRSKAFSEASRVTKKYFIFSFNNKFSISHLVKKTVLKKPFYTVSIKQIKEELSESFTVAKAFCILPFIAGETILLCEKRTK